MAEQYYARLEGIVSPSFHTKNIVLVGCGGGSDQALKLARFGPASLTLIDRDIVAVENLTRTAYGKKDLGKPKVEALAARVRDANPLVEVRAVQADLETAAGKQAAARACYEADLVVAGTDSFAVQTLLNKWAQSALCQGRIVPTVFIGVHLHARGGIVISTIPGETPCYRCVAKRRYQAAGEEGPSGLDLPGARGSGLDGSFIDLIALKIIVAILERGQSSEYGRFFAGMSGRTQVVVRTHPEYRWENTDIFDVVLSDLPREPKDYKAELQAQAFFAMDSLWLRTEFDPQCPDCGRELR